jgi:hypothetical protein
MMTRSEWNRLQYEYFQRLIDENRGQKRQVHRAAQVGGGDQRRAGKIGGKEGCETPYTAARPCQYIRRSLD